MSFGARASAQDVEDDDARTLFALGEGAYEQGRFEAALNYFEQAYALSHRGQLLFNIGQAADRLRLDRRALEAFEGYLAEVPDAPNRRVVEARIVILRRAVAASTPTTDSTPTPPVTPEPSVVPSPSVAPDSADVAPTEPTATTTEAAERESDGSPTGWVIAGAGGGVLAVGAVFLGLGVRDYRSVTEAPDGSSWSSVEAAHDRASMRITVGTVLLGVGAATAATGIILAVRSSSDEEPSTVNVHLLPNAVFVRGSF